MLQWSYNRKYKGVVVERLDAFNSYIRETRSKLASPFDIVHQTFRELDFDKQPQDFFYENASHFIETMRNECWKRFTDLEERFTYSALDNLIVPEKYENLTPVEAIRAFNAAHVDFMYALSLSNTQSRRSRAGKEFEHILELLLASANIPSDVQGNIGRAKFAQQNLGKLVDFVIPNATQYTINKHKAILLSAKTTLRERWQEVPEELNRTGAREIFLATLDENITKDTIDTLYESNTTIVTTKTLQEERYSIYNDRVLCFEEFLLHAKDVLNRIDTDSYSPAQREEIVKTLHAQAQKHTNHSYLFDFYQNKIRDLTHES